MSKKISSLLLIAIVFASSAMEMPVPESSYLDPLVKELKGLIIQHLIKAKTLDEAVKDIRSLRRVNKKFYKLINDPQLAEWIIRELAKRYSSSILVIPKDPRAQRNFEIKENARLIVAAAALNTTGSIQWLQNYLKDTENMEMAEYLLVQMAKDNVNIIDGLLKAGVNPNARSKEYGFSQPRTTALEAAVIFNYIPGVKRLLASGANINLETSAEFSPLYLAVTRQVHPDIIKLLLDAGAKNDKDDLSGAIFNKLLKRDMEYALPTITLLLDAGAPINRIVHERTVLDYALLKEEDYPEIIELLKSRGAKRASELP